MVDNEGIPCRQVSLRMFSKALFANKVGPKRSKVELMWRTSSFDIQGSLMDNSSENEILKEIGILAS
jgi:hypothetical protein